MPRTVGGRPHLQRRGRGQPHDLRPDGGARHLDHHAHHDGVLHGQAPRVAGRGPRAVPRTPTRDLVRHARPVHRARRDHEGVPAAERSRPRTTPPGRPGHRDLRPLHPEGHLCQRHRHGQPSRPGPVDGPGAVRPRPVLTRACRGSSAPLRLDAVRWRRPQVHRPLLRADGDQDDHAQPAAAVRVVGARGLRVEARQLDVADPQGSPTRPDATAAGIAMTISGSRYAPPDAHASRTLHDVRVTRAGDARCRAGRVRALRDPAHQHGRHRAPGGHLPQYPLSALPEQGCPRRDPADARDRALLRGTGPGRREPGSARRGDRVLHPRGPHGTGDSAHRPDPRERTGDDPRAQQPHRRRADRAGRGAGHRGVAAQRRHDVRRRPARGLRDPRPHRGVVDARSSRSAGSFGSGRRAPLRRALPGTPGLVSGALGLERTLSGRHR
ncbi:cytochrome P450 [Prescottella equi NBRC 101255 = C 7]|nr:cytochrome P450 [Prescottella equi NBRC 101255 = C 7]